MTFSSFCSTSVTSFRNLHKATNQACRQLSKQWLPATVPLVAPAKRQVKLLTWRGSGALGGASREIAEQYVGVQALPCVKKS